ncbi:Lactonase, 7-bladed beta-propeller-domain-containing protein [Mycena alexandri]|uniref:Lactonase, 7-bladed beta-propeller-domain-containing protein n=1 Tax=Mycena alexandri TaxID=1745969 RepID=A0AAD6SRY8_9AGAR|nr:Lactonase, 7-bladed beta-propeller-domain-containing protein [Mycena alexandri]
MVKFTIYTGGYTSFIVSYLFDTQTSALTYLDTIPTTANPSWLTPHLTNPNIIYAVNELGPVGALQAYATSPSGGLTFLNEVSSGGNGPAFCAPLSTGQVAIMNYGSGNGEIIPTVNDGTGFDNSTSVLVTFAPPPGGASNPHMAWEYKNEVFIPDLGGDKLWRIGQTGAPGNFSIHGFIEHPKGTGPRHMSILDDYIYVIHETANLITKQAVPVYPNGTSPFVANATSLPADRPANSTFAAAELILREPTAAYPHPYIYVSNRNIGTTPDPRGDTIGIFDPTGLKVVNQVYTGLVNIRGMALGVGEAGQAYLVAMGAVSGGMVIYKRTEGGAALEEVARNSSAVARTASVMVQVGDSVY